MEHDNLKEKTPADPLRVEAAYNGNELIGYRLVTSGTDNHALVWLDQKGMPGIRAGQEFVPYIGERIDYRPIPLHAQVAALTATPAQPEVSWIGASSHHLMQPAPGVESNTAGAALPEPALMARDTYTGEEVRGYDADAMRDFGNQQFNAGREFEHERSAALRASHGQAPAGAVPVQGFHLFNAYRATLIEMRKERPHWRHAGLPADDWFQLTAGEQMAFDAAAKLMPARPAPTAQAAPASAGGVMQFGGCPECGSRSCVARACSRAVSHSAQAIPGVQWQCGPQANGFTAPAAGAVAGPVEWREVARRCLTAMDDTVRWRETGFGRPPEQTCMDAIAELQALLAAAPTPAAQADSGATFQQRVQPWLLECFGAEIAADRVERNHRFLEESLELVQSLGCTASEAHQLVDYVFGRPVGEPVQEAGGVMVTLAALCLASGLDMHAAGETELARISQPGLVAKIRAKQAAKPKHSPLPEAVRANSGVVEDAALTDEVLCGLQAAADALEWIAKRERVVGDVIERVDDIRHASRLAAEGYRRIGIAMTIIDSLDAARATGASNAKG